MTAVKKWAREHKSALIKWGLFALVVVLLALPAVFGGNGSTTAFDPNSTKPDGTKAFAMLMQQAGADFSVGDRPATGTAVLLRDTLSNDEATGVLNWVKAGGHLVVADPNSSLVRSTSIQSPTTQPKVLTTNCSSAYTAGVGSIRPNSNADYTLWAKAAGATQCFPYKNGYFMSVNSVGSGAIVDLGSPDLFMNQDLDHADNAVLITNLVAPKAGTNVVFLTTADFAASSGDSSGGSSLSDLMPPRVKEGILQLVFAFFVLILWRGRRLGKPVEEFQAVQIPASQLTIAEGNLLETASQSQYAATIMRDDLKRSMAGLLGVDTNLPDQALIQILEDRTHIPRERIEAVLFAMPASDDQQLINLSQQIEYLYMEVSRVR